MEREADIGHAGGVEVPDDEDPGFAGHLRTPHITDALKPQGLARDAVSKFQAVRKQLDLPHEARISVMWSAEGALHEALPEHAAYVAGEILATDCQPSEEERDWWVLKTELGSSDGYFSADVDGNAVFFKVEVVSI